MPCTGFSLVTRPGTNRFTGSVFEYFRNEALDANDWFNNRDGLPKPALRQNNFGGVIGGPIFRDKTFFFFSYEGLRLRLPKTASPLPLAGIMGLLSLGTGFALSVIRRRSA